MKFSGRILSLTAVLAAVASPAARASFHLMQIEQVIGGVNGDMTAQAIQLRMRSSFQNLVSNARIRAWDSAGANPVIIIDFPSDVPNFAAGARVLATTASFNSKTSPTAIPNFTMTNPIPVLYMVAGIGTPDRPIPTPPNLSRTPFTPPAPPPLGAAHWIR